MSCLVRRCQDIDLPMNRVSPVSRSAHRRRLVFALLVRDFTVRVEPILRHFDGEHISQRQSDHAQHQRSWKRHQAEGRTEWQVGQHQRD